MGLSRLLSRCWPQIPLSAEVLPHTNAIAIPSHVTWSPLNTLVAAGKRTEGTADQASRLHAEPLLMRQISTVSDCR